MKRTININFQGQLVTIEETAYQLLNQYIQSLKDYFRNEADGTEIVNDIECRIAELFGNRLKHGISCITNEDVASIIKTIGTPEEFDTEFEEQDDSSTSQAQSSTRPDTQLPPPFVDEEKRQLSRNANDRLIGGVASGLAYYLKIDPVFVRLIFVVLFTLLFWVYIIMWIVLPVRYLESNVSKRLYRNPNDKYLGGVCGGIAAYFKIDTWIPRVLFLLPVIFNIFDVVKLPFFAFNHMFRNIDFGWNINMSFVVVYIVLWIIMPKAVSVKQKLEMMGEDEYLRSIRATVSDNVAQARSSRADVSNTNVANNNDVGTPTVNPIATNIDSINQDYTTDSGIVTGQDATPPPPPPIYTPRSTYNSPQSERSGCLNFLAGIFKIIFFGFVGIVAAGLMISLFGLMFAGAQFMSLESLFIDQGFEHTLLWMSIALTLAVPTIAVIAWIVRRMMKAKSRPIIGYSVAVLWFIGIVAGLMLGFNVTRKFSTESLQETTIELTSPSSNKLYVEMARYPLDYFGSSKITIHSPIFSQIELDALPFFNVEEDSLLFNNIQLRMKTSKDTLFHVKTIFSSYEKNFKAAKSNVRDFDFKIEQNDSVLLLPQFFKTPKLQGYRSQFVVVEIYVPSGSKLEVSDDLSDYQRTISSKAMSRRYGDDYGYKNNLKWDSDEEYVLENNELTQTKLNQDSI